MGFKADLFNMYKNEYSISVYERKADKPKAYLGSQLVTQLLSYEFEQTQSPAILTKTCFEFIKLTETEIDA